MAHCGGESPVHASERQQRHVRGTRALQCGGAGSRGRAGGHDVVHHGDTLPAHFGAPARLDSERRMHVVDIQRLGTLETFVDATFEESPDIAESKAQFCAPRRRSASIRSFELPPKRTR